MAWTATLIEKKVHPDNPQMAFVRVQFTNGVRTFQSATWGTDLTVDFLRQWGKLVIDNATSADTSLTNLPNVGSSITIQDPPAPDPALVQFKNRWRQLMVLKRLNSANGSIVSQQATLQGQVETSLLANPSWINEVS